MKIGKSLFVLILMGMLSLVGNLVGPKHGIFEALPGMAILVLISIVGIILAKVIPGKIPAVAYIVTLGCIVTYPGFPGAAIVSKYMSKVDFLSLTTPILAYVGISIGKDLDSFKKLRLENYCCIMCCIHRNLFRICNNRSTYIKIFRTNIKLK